MLLKRAIGRKQNTRRDDEEKTSGSGKLKFFYGISGYHQFFTWNRDPISHWWAPLYAHALSLRTGHLFFSFIVQNSWVYYRIWRTTCHDKKFSSTRKTSTLNLSIGLLSSLQTYEVTPFERMNNKDQIIRIWYPLGQSSLSTQSAKYIKSAGLIAWLRSFVRNYIWFEKFR